MKKQIMVKAWDIAKKAVAKHGGKAIEYIAEAMKIAWALISKLEKAASQSIALNPEQAERLGGEENAVRLAVAQAVESGQVELFIEELEKDVINKLESLAKESIKLNPEQAERLGNEEQAVRFLVEQAIEEDAVMEYIQELEKDIESKKKSNEPLYIEISEGSRKHKSYIAEVVGDHPIYKIERKFVSEQHENLRIKYAYLENGKAYEIQDAGDREYVKVENGQMVEISKDEAVELGIANSMEKIADLLQRAIKIKEAKGEEVPYSVEDGLKAAKAHIANSSYIDYIYGLENIIVPMEFNLGL